MSDVIDLPVINERVGNLDRNFQQHVIDDKEHFDKLFNYLHISFDKIDRRFDGMEDQVTALQTYKDQQTGAMASAKMLGSMVAGFFGVAVGAIATYFSSKGQ